VAPASADPKAAERTWGHTQDFCELTLQSRDPVGLALFDQQVFGWEDSPGMMTAIWLSCGEQARLGLWSPGPKEFGDEGGRHVHF
jgi:hypothetical protein